MYYKNIFNKPFDFPWFLALFYCRRLSLTNLIYIVSVIWKDPKGPRFTITCNLTELIFVSSRILKKPPIKTSLEVGRKWGEVGVRTEKTPSLRIWVLWVWWETGLAPSLEKGSKQNCRSRLSRVWAAFPSQQLYKALPHTGTSEGRLRLFHSFRQTNFRL